MKAASSGVAGIIRRVATVLLALTLLGALWSTALSRVSERQTAVSILTNVGVDLINPLLLSNSSGLSQGVYQQLETQAQSHPTQALAISFIKIPINGSEIKGKNFTDGSRVIYSHIANAYYDNGPGAVFHLPPQLQSLIDSYNPLVQGSATSSALPKLPIPQIPSWISPLTSYFGVSPTTLTAAGHSTYTSNMTWYWLASIILAIVVAAMSAGWARLENVAWSLFHASWHIGLIGLIATLLVNFNQAKAAPYQGLLDPVLGMFMPVFYTAAIVGILGVVASRLGKTFLHGQEASAGAGGRGTLPHERAAMDRESAMPSGRSYDRPYRSPASPSSWSQQPDYGEMPQSPYSAQSPYSNSAQSPFGAPPSYPDQPPYPGQSPYASPNSPYSEQPPYSSPQSNFGQSPYSSQSPYPGQPPYGQQSPYPDQPPYGQQQPYPGPQSYPPNSAPRKYPFLPDSQPFDDPFDGR